MRPQTPIRKNRKRLLADARLCGEAAEKGDLHFGTIRINFAEANVKGSLGGPFFVAQRRVYGLGDRKNCRPNRISCRPKRDCRRP